MPALPAGINGIENSCDDCRRRPDCSHGVGSHETYCRPVGSTSLITTFVASTVPMFDTWMPIWIVSPCFGL